MAPKKCVLEKIMHKLLVELEELVSVEKKATAKVIAHIGEVDEKQLYREAACSSMFRYCVERLRFEEPAAYTRIEVARAARRFPLILRHLESGEVHLTGMLLLSRQLTEENHRELLERAIHKTKRQIEELCVELAPRAFIPDSIRALPAPRALPIEAQKKLAPERVANPARVEPLTPDYYAMRFTAHKTLKAKLDRAQELLRFQGANDLPSVIDRAITMLLADVEKKRFGKTAKPREVKAANTNSRRVPNAMKRAVCERDQNQCTYEDESGRRCSERATLEYDHIKPFARGGQTTLDNLRLRCRAHNLLAAEVMFGK
jgi:hypothetical protein